MAKYQAYSDYKETSVLGIESIPTDWDIQRIKFLFNIGRGRVISEQELEDDGQFPVYSSQTKNNGCLGYIGTYDFDCEQITWTTDGANAGTVFLRNGKHNCTNVCGTLQPKYSDLCMGFTLYCLEYVTQFHKRPDTNGAKIMNNEMADISISQPPACDREKIAEFLDHETAQIDTLIDKQQQLIKLLKEKRQAVISHAVTKGLNPDAAMKDSGVEWLGEVPEHWKVCSLKYLVSAPIIDGPHLTPIRQDKGIPFISAEAISQGYINFDKKWGYISRADHEIYSKRYSPRKDDILMVKLGATTGVVAMVETDEDFNVWVPLATIRPRDDISSKFIFYLLQSSSVRDAIQLSWTYGTQQTLGLGTLANISLPVPPEKESYEIVKLIESKVPIYDESVKKCEISLQYLKERRTALISAAVTGKIDVRSWHAPKSSNQGSINGR
ncbi:restriction endonuclease subunit S [Colwellia sp. BRX8-7]|uniref:restriction endonuclease subunit S n=1 Tax=Colwellia sp. BRX8-7 TaxID=2759833 RepID=UPI0015F4AC8B|nr:restriction endonuclease subunit S [Colwellia sp. BRX8-7]MBA6336665.1 restriction endonuclease subunit S [Colwellia sp. BRX8-7]